MTRIRARTREWERVIIIFRKREFSGSHEVQDTHHIKLLFFITRGGTVPSCDVIRDPAKPKTPTMYRDDINKSFDPSSSWILKAWLNVSQNNAGRSLSKVMAAIFQSMWPVLWHRKALVTSPIWRHAAPRPNLWLLWFSEVVRERRRGSQGLT